MFKSKLLNISLLLGLLVPTVISGKSNKLIAEKSFTVSQNQNLTLDCDAGDVELNTWNKDEVLVQIFGNKKAERYFSFDFSQNSNGVELEADRKGSSWLNIFNSISIIYKITVPEKFNITAKTSGGDIFISTLEGKMELNTSGGDIKVAEGSGAISAHTSGGDIEINNCISNVNSATSGGDINCNKLTGDFFAKTSGGDIMASVINGKVKCQTSGGDITIKAEGENQGIHASTSGGDISIKLDSTIKADLELRATGGDICNKFKNMTLEEASSSKVIAKLNGGGNLIKCRTSGGNISLKSK